MNQRQTFSFSNSINLTQTVYPFQPQHQRLLAPMLSRGCASPSFVGVGGRSLPRMGFLTGHAKNNGLVARANDFVWLLLSPQKRCLQIPASFSHA